MVKDEPDVEEEKSNVFWFPRENWMRNPRRRTAGWRHPHSQGVGTIVAEGKQVINIGGKDYLLELPLRADFAFIRGSVADKFGNTTYNGTTRNFNPLMAMAADHVIVGACEIVEVGEIDPNNVVTSGIFVDAYCSEVRNHGRFKGNYRKKSCEGIERW